MNEFYIIGKWSILNDPTISQIRQSIMAKEQACKVKTPNNPNCQRDRVSLDNLIELSLRQFSQKGMDICFERVQAAQDIRKARNDCVNFYMLNLESLKNRVTRQADNVYNKYEFDRL